MSDINPVYTVSQEQVRSVLAFYGEPYDRLVNENERKRITGISRSTAFRLEKLGEFPARRKPGIGQRKCTWLLSELLYWVREQPTVTH